MPANGQNLGVDYSFGLYDQNTGQIIELGIVENVKITAMKHDIVARPYNDLPRYTHIHDGYGGTFQIVRNSRDFEDLQITLNNNLENGVSILPGYLNMTIREIDGTVTRRQYTGCDFFMTEMVEVSRERNVRQTIEMKASDLVNLA